MSTITEDIQSLEEMIITGVRIDRNDQANHVLLAAVASGLVILCKQLEALAHEVTELRNRGLWVQTPTNCF